MAIPYIGEIRMFAFGRIPQGWQPCDGSLLPISQYDVLFALIGTTYGGDGQTTFAVPDLRGRVPVHQGQGPGLTNRTIGEVSGSETVTLIANQMPAHTHALLASANAAAQTSPAAGVLAHPPGGQLYLAETPGAPLNPASVGQVGGSQPHDNTAPFLCISFMIAYEGIFPSQS